MGVSQSTWKKFLKNEIKKYDDSWSIAIKQCLKQLQDTQNLRQNDIILMNATFKVKGKYSNNAKKLLRRTGLTEEDMKSQLDRSFASSMMSETQSYVYHEKACQINDTSQICLEYFANLTDIIKYHLNQNELGQIIEIFKKDYQKQIYNDYSDYLKSLSNFCKLLYDLIVVYYDLQQMKKQYTQYMTLVNNDTMSNFISNTLMQDEIIYEFTFEKIKNGLLNQVIKTTNFMKQNILISCQDINPSFQQKNCQEPYKLAIKALQKIDQKKGPCSKAKVIIKFSQLMTQAIQNQAPGKTIQSDDIMPIINYIVIKSQIYDIQVHLEIMGSLLASNIMSSTFGYYFACISSVLNK